MPTATYNLEWLNHNSQRAYPFLETASRTDVSGTITLPNHLFVELQLCIPVAFQADTTRFFLRTVSIFPSGVYVAIAYDDLNSTWPIIAACTIPRGDGSDYQVGKISGLDNFPDITGHITLGQIDPESSLPSGQFFFTPQATALDPDTIRPQIRGVSSVIVVNGTERSAPIFGDIELVAGNNIRLTTSPGPGGQTLIHIHAISGENLNAECNCEDVTGSPNLDEAPCIKTINGIAPDASGNLQLTGSRCVKIASQGNRLRIANTCADPCCGCNELEVLTRQLEKLQQSAATLEGAIGRMEAQIQAVQARILAGNLGACA